MTYKKPEVAYLNIREKPAMAGNKQECGERGCCVRSNRVW